MGLEITRLEISRPEKMRFGKKLGFVNLKLRISNFEPSFLLPEAELRTLNQFNISLPPSKGELTLKLETWNLKPEPLNFITPTGL